MDLPKDKENLVMKIRALEKCIYSDRKLFERALADYEESFGRSDFLYSEKLAKSDGYDHTLMQFADAIGFIYGDTISDISSIETYNPVLSQENKDHIARHTELKKLEIEVIRAVCDYRIAHSERLGKRN